MFISLGARPYMVPAPALWVGTYDADDRPNLMAATWGGVCSSQPPCMAVSITRTCRTHNAIHAREAFSISLPSADMVAQFDFCGIISGRDEEKFTALGLHPVAAEHVDAPFVAECPAVIELRLLQYLELGSHTQFIGEIMDVKIREHCLDEQDIPLVPRINPLFYAPISREYWGCGPLLARAFAVGRSIGRKPQE